MTDKLGVYPVDATTDTGKLRLLTGDSQGAPITPPGGGDAVTANYAYWSDDEMGVFLLLAGGNIMLAAAEAYTQLAASVALDQSSSGNRNYRTADLGLSGAGPGGDIRLIAREWRYTAEQAAAMEADAYAEMIPTVSTSYRVV